MTGRHVPPRRPDLLAGSLRGLLAHPAIVQAHGVAGRDRATACYRWSQVAERTVAVYDRVVTQGSPTSAGRPGELRAGMA